MNVKQRDLVKQGIEEYTGSAVVDLQVHPDPMVDGTFAFRAKLQNEQTLDFLLIGGTTRFTSALQIMEMLEECTFETWPPKPGKLRFF